jgi:hypothetical protein
MIGEEVAQELEEEREQFERHLAGLDPQRLGLCATTPRRHQRRRPPPGASPDRPWRLLKKSPTAPSGCAASSRIGEEPTMRAWEGCSSGLVPGGWGYYVQGQPQDSPDDLDLAWECATLAQEVRDGQWDALERLGVLLAAGDGADATERMRSLPQPLFLEAAQAVVDLDCHSYAPDDGSEGVEED